MARGSFALGIGCLALGSTPVHAWSTHRTLMPYVLMRQSASVRDRLNERAHAPCRDEDDRIFSELAQRLALNPKAQLAPLTQSCESDVQISVRDILLGNTTDEPDLGMDQDLPNSADPRGQRKTMGGERGPTSQGFRHMWFSGWNPLHPLSTFQIPLSSIGEAPERSALMAAEAKRLLKEGHTAWGIRVLGWALHYVQDLAQPFHTAQIPSFAMIPWFSLLSWPPQTGLSHLVREATRTVSNYHYAFEDWMLLRLLQEDSPVQHCLEDLPTEGDSTLAPIARALTVAKSDGNIRPIAAAVAQASRRLTPELGSAEISLFGKQLMLQSFDLPNHVGHLDYNDYQWRPDKTGPRAELDTVGCQTLSIAVLASRLVIDWALKP